MENQHRKITGYRELTEDDILWMNALKAMGAELGKTIEKLAAREGTDGRWLSIGHTHLQQGIMALVRSIAKPESF